MSAVGGFGAKGMTSRWLGALFLVLAAYNPSGHSYVHWLLESTDSRWSLKVLVGMVLGIAILTYVFASARSLGRVGILTTVAFFASVVWALVDHGYLRSLTTWSWVTVTLTLAGSVLAVGMSWSHIRGQLSGQADANDVTLR